MQPGHIEEYNRERSDEVASRVAGAVESLLARGERVTFYSVAACAGVARSTLYRRADLRVLVAGARGAGKSPVPAGASPEMAALREELAAARRERDELASLLAGARPVRYFLVELPPAA